MKIIFILASLLMTQAYAGVPLKDKTVLFKTKGFEPAWGCPNLYKQNIKIKYHMGLECLVRNQQGVCETLLPFYAVEHKRYDEKYFVVVSGQEELTQAEVLAASKDFQSNAKKMATRFSPFVNKTFMISNGIGMASVVLFPVTIPLDIITMPAQFGIYWLEQVIRTHSYKGIGKNMEKFVLRGKQSKGTTFNNPDVDYNLNKTFPFNELVLGCPDSVEND